MVLLAELFRGRDVSGVGDRHPALGRLDAVAVAAEGDAQFVPALRLFDGSVQVVAHRLADLFWERGLFGSMGATSLAGGYRLRSVWGRIACVAGVVAGFWLLPENRWMPTVRETVASLLFLSLLLLLLLPP